MNAPITKIQFLTDRETGHGIYYCHTDDENHNPTLTVETYNRQVIISASETLFKVKKNPQKKNRVDIYMSVPEAHTLGGLIQSITEGTKPQQWSVSNANPHAAATGTMKLPTIIWSRFAKFLQCTASIRVGTKMQSQGGYLNLDFEAPDASHIKMTNKEVHIGVNLNSPTGQQKDNQSFPVIVPEHELQRRTNEQNPVPKVYGDFVLKMDIGIAAGLGELLSQVET